MKFYKLIIFILIVFLKTETLLSDINLFNVNNIKLEKNEKTTNNLLANRAIKKGFDQLISKILLEEDLSKISNLNFSEINQLVTYYQISNIIDEKENKDFVNFSVTFDKDKIHNLFYKMGISYSEISDKELFILPILNKNGEVFVFNNNFFYENWNEIYDVELIEFILPLENIEIIQHINSKKDNLINIELNKIFREYPNKNLALILIEDHKKIYFKTRIQGKMISRSLNLEKSKLNLNEKNKNIIINSKKEIINIVKSENLIDIRTPSFLNIRLILSKKTSLVEFNNKVNKIDLVEKVYIKDFNKDYMNLRIKYLGKLEKIIDQLKNENINLKLIDDAWIINSL